MDTVSYMLGKRAGGGTMVETDPIYSSSPASGITSNDISNWNGKSDFSGDYDDLTNKPTIPEDMQYSTMPTASVDNLGKIVQFTGTTDSTYTNGYFYKCVSDGQATPTYSWEEVEVQAGGGGASYTAGTNISIDSNNAINCTIPFLLGSSTDKSLALGPSSSNVLGRFSTVVGVGASANLSQGMVAIGNNAQVDGSYAGANEAVIIGQGSKASSARQIAIGRFAGIPYDSQIGYAISLGYKAAANKVNQMMIGSSDANINEIAMYTSNGVKVMATESYVDNLVGNINTVLATLTTPSNGGNA